jgi:hypothetical protein
MLKEVEIKALLTEEQYKELKTTLPQMFKRINSDKITTIKFKPHDVRVRYSDKINEVVFKDGDATTYARNEISINLKDRADCHAMVKLLTELGMEQHPSWTKEKNEFIYPFDGQEYVLSLQHIENFEYILEAEIMSDEPDRHIPNLKKILSSLGCEPIDPDQFKAKINEYIQRYGK